MNYTIHISHIYPRMGFPQMGILRDTILNGWFMENPNLKWMITRDTPILMENLKWLIYGYRKPWTHGWFIMESLHIFMVSNPNSFLAYPRGKRFFQTPWTKEMAAAWWPAVQRSLSKGCHLGSIRCQTAAWKPPKKMEWTPNNKKSWGWQVILDVGERCYGLGNRRCCGFAKEICIFCGTFSWIVQDLVLQSFLGK